MTSTLKKFFLTAVSSGSTVKSYDQSPYPVEISEHGSVSVDPRAIVSTESAKQQIEAVRELHGKQLIEQAK